MKLQGLALEQWRDYFNTAESDIFDIIKHAISVAALDYPTELRLQRDQIAEKLFTLTSATRCSSCDCVRFALSDNAGVSKENKLVIADNAGDSKENKLVVADNAGGSKENKLVVADADNAGGSKENKLVVADADNAGGSKEIKASDINSGTGDNPLVNQITSYVESEALGDEIEREVLTIKDILLNGQDESESDSELFDSLRRLESMALTVDNLKATQIGKAVNPFRKHSSKPIRQLAKTLIVGWKELVDAWVSATEAIVDTPESVKSKTESKLLQPKMPLSSQQHEFKTSDELPVQLKLEDAKRKLQERYQEVENAKKRRTIQVMELHDLPGKKKSYIKPGNRNRQSMNGRR